jgi:glycosyltransferase involved in cell wall biosynthesis
VRLSIITNCGAAEEYVGRCIESLKRQTFTDWRCFVQIDPCGDGTYGAAVAAAANDPRFSIVANEQRLFAGENLVRGVARSGSAPEDVIVVVDGDDWLNGDDALATIAETYARNDCWLTYGSWISTRGAHDGNWPAYADDTSDFRRAPWLATAVRTWKKWLWDRIDDRDLRDEDGRYVVVAEDQACMLPMLEMATTRRARHIAQPLLVYNRLNPHNIGKVMHEKGLATAAMIRTRTPYAAIHARSIHVA